MAVTLFTNEFNWGLLLSLLVGAGLYSLIYFGAKAYYLAAGGHREALRARPCLGERARRPRRTHRAAQRLIRLQP